MKISLLIRTYNEEENIRRCLIQVLKQSRLPDEVIVIDNGSTDKTLTIIEKINKPYLIQVIHNPTKGYSSGLNLGFKVAKSDFIVYLSADCFPDEDWLLTLAHTYKDTGCHVIQGQEQPYPLNSIHYVLNKEKSSNNKICKIQFFNNTNTLYKKEILARFMPFEDVDLQGGEDTVMSIRYKKAGLVAYLNPGAVVYHNMFPSMDEFKKRMYKHGRLAWFMFKRFPTAPRVYLNSFYWGSKEIALALIHFDNRFLIVGYTRLLYTIKGILDGFRSNVRGL